MQRRRWVGSLGEEGFPDRYFDLVAAADVLEHLHEDDAPAAAREAIQVARRFIFMNRLSGGYGTAAEDQRRSFLPENAPTSNVNSSWRRK